jgi:uncharacterized membrane protein
LTMRATPFAVIVLLASLAGFGFAAVSTFDSTAHLDRQVHGIHCSYFLGMGKEDVTGNSGCYTTLMSPYSSLFRQAVWGGVPVALAGMSVFAFLVFWTVWMMAQGLRDPRAAGFLLLATVLPVATSAVMAYLSIVDLDAVCKMCMGIYLSSGAAFVAAALLLNTVRNNEKQLAGKETSEEGAQRVSYGMLAGAFGLGVLFVAVPFGAYAALTPDFSHYVGNCGSLRTTRDTDGILVPFGPQGKEIELIEVLDPLCKACGMLEKRLASMPEASKVSRKGLLFPLDNTCNWMVDQAIHPGACAVSEAVLCAGTGVDDVLRWAIENQDEILERSAKDPAAAERMVKAAFPSLGNCIGSAAVRAKLNLALRWAVKNHLQVLTPQIFVLGQRLCDEDTDIGLDFTLSRLIARAKTAPMPKEELILDEPPAPRPRHERVKPKPVFAEPLPAKPRAETPAPEPATPAPETERPGEEPEVDEKPATPEASGEEGEVSEKPEPAPEAKGSLDEVPTPTHEPKAAAPAPAALPEKEVTP